MEGHGRSRKVKEGHGWSFPITRLTFQVRKVMALWLGGRGGGWPVGFGFGTYLHLGLGLTILFINF